MPNDTKKAKLRRGPGRALLRSHRRVGVALSLVFVAICVTGILLNHQEDLSLNSKPVKADWIYEWYGIAPENGIAHYELSNTTLSEIDGQLFLGAQPIGHFAPVRGAAGTDAFLAVAHPSTLSLFTWEGDLIESLSDRALPGNAISGIATSENGTLKINTDEGAYAADEAILEWTPTTWQPGDVLSRSEPTPALERQLLQAYRGNGITWGRVILDLHTGRFFGNIGKWVVDLSAVALLFLTFTGLVYTFRYLKKARQRQS